MKEIANYDSYLISEDGRVFSKKRKRFLSLRKGTDGYICVTITKGDGKSVYKAVHRLVAEAYIPNPENKPQVGHIDCDVRNNHKNNLNWVTQLENNLHSINLGRRPKRHKSKS